MKIVMTQSVCPEGIKALEESGLFTEIYSADNPDPNNYLDKMADADALIVRVAKCDSNAIENSPNLKVIGKTGVGYDAIDVKKAAEKGIPVVITPGANNRSVAEHAVAMMFALAKNIVEGDSETRKGNWEIRGAKKTFELEGKTVGVIGLGAVYYADYEALLRDSDIITIHVPLTDETRDMINAKNFAEMKNTAIIINCSRGGIINETDLINALNNNEIAGAATDVFCAEPIKPDYPLLQCKNLIVSPHSAAQTREAVIKMALMCVRGCVEILKGNKWPFVADKSVYSHEKWQGRPEAKL